jgi:hypothetical protein
MPGYKSSWTGTKANTQVQNLRHCWRMLCTGVKLLVYVCTCVRNFFTWVWFFPKYETFLLGYETFLSGYETFYPGTKLFYLGMKLSTWVRNFLPGYETFYLGTKLFTWVRNFLPETFYLGMKLFTWVRNFLAWVRNFLPGCKPCEKPQWLRLFPTPHFLGMETSGMKMFRTQKNGSWILNLEVTDGFVFLPHFFQVPAHLKGPPKS